MAHHLKHLLDHDANETVIGRQCAALPFKQEGGDTLVLMVTSRETGRWVLPKGWAEKHLSGAELAAKEAYEEAGIVGDIVGKSVGCYRYTKQLRLGREVECAVKVFPLKVTQLLDTWPEHRQRRREWFTFAQAAMQVDEAELVTMLLGFVEPIGEKLERRERS